MRHRTPRYDLGTTCRRAFYSCVAGGSALTVATLAPCAASGAEYLQAVEVGPFPVQAPQAEILVRAKRCMAHQLAPGVQGAQLFITQDDQEIVANNVQNFSSRMVTWPLRSHVTVEAREGRFKVTQTNIEWFIDPNGWVGVGKWWGSNWKGVETTLTVQSAQIAACIKDEPKADW